MGNSAALKAGLEPYPGYHLSQVLGSGGYGQVWEAETQEHKKIALKFLPCTDSMVTAREIRMRQALRHLRHPHLIRIDQVWCFGGYIVLAMELADGSLLDLFDAYQTEFGTPIPADQVCLYLTQAADALDFLNARKHVIEGNRVAIQHCDVKPSNLLLFGENVKLADYGLSSLTTTSLQFHRRAGTLDYTAPEVFQGRLSDRTDQYALAVTYCQLRSGQLPFADTPRTFKKGYVRPDPDLSMLTPGEQPIVARALARAPQDRWPSCAEMMRELTKQVS